ncbi:MAG: glycosyltransferase family 4 protein [Armatimonadota bacterium]|nr:glycosyltransferase family 4 protein [Armatimonadota bacterium]
MRVLLTHVTLGRGGDAVQWTALADSLRRAGHDVTVAGAVAVRPYSTRGAAAGARTVVGCFPWQVRDALELALVPVAAARAWWTARQGVDLIVYHAGPYAVLGPLLAWLLRVPLVACLDAHVPAERGYRSESYWRSVHEGTARWLGRTARVVVTPSRAIADHYRRIGLPATKVLVRPGGVLQRHIEAGLRLVETMPPMARASQCVLGFAGSLSDWHRVDLLLEALALLVARADGIAYRLVVVGGGREESRLRALAQRLGIARRVQWRGSLPHDDAVAAMAEFDIAVLPSTLPTGSPLKLVEYAAMGRPIVAPALPNIGDLLAPETEAILVEPGRPAVLAEAIARLAHDPVLARRIGRSAQSRVRALTWEEAARLLVRAALGEEPAPTPGGPAGCGPMAVAGTTGTGHAAGHEP